MPWVPPLATLVAAVCSSAATAAAFHLAPQLQRLRRRPRHLQHRCCCTDGHHQAAPTAATEAEAAAAAVSSESSCCEVWEDPEAQYKPSNPRWLVEAATQPAAGTLANAQQCPLLAELEALPLPELGTRACRDTLYCLDPGVAYLNHGSYGAAFRPCMEVQGWYRSLLEAQPVRFMETTAMQGLVQASAEVARFVGADPDDLFPVANATSACNAVIISVVQAATEAAAAEATAAAEAATAAPAGRGSAKGAKKERKDDGTAPLESKRAKHVILMTSLTYPAVKSTIVREAARAGLAVVVVQLGLPELTEPDLALRAVQQAAARYDGRLLLAVLDHVVSFPPVVLPVEAMVQACKQAGAWVLVDGAHAVGQVPLNVPAIGAHFYTSNLHKWCCTPKGTAFLWAHPSTHAPHTLQPGSAHTSPPHTSTPPTSFTASSAIPRTPQTPSISNPHPSTPPTSVPWPQAPLQLRPPITSHGFGKGARAEFVWQGTQDLTGWLAVPAALRLLTRMGPENVMQHNARMVRQAAHELRQRWGGHLQVLGAEAGCSTEQILSSVSTPPLSPQEEPPSGGSEPMAAGSTSVAAAAADRPAGVVTGPAAVGCMLALELPPLLGQPHPPSIDFAIQVHDILRERHNIEVPVACMDGRLWVRLSAQAYNIMQDYARLGDAIDDMRGSNQKC